MICMKSNIRPPEVVHPLAELISSLMQSVILDLS
jgi:hypothetical protein